MSNKLFTSLEDHVDPVDPIDTDRVALHQAHDEIHASDSAVTDAVDTRNAIEEHYHVRGELDRDVVEELKEALHQYKDQYGEGLESFNVDPANYVESMEALGEVVGGMMSSIKKQAGRFVDHLKRFFHGVKTKFVDGTRALRKGYAEIDVILKDATAASFQDLPRVRVREVFRLNERTPANFTNDFVKAMGNYDVFYRRAMMPFIDRMGPMLKGEVEELQTKYEGETGALDAAKVVAEYTEHTRRIFSEFLEAIPGHPSRQDDRLLYTLTSGPDFSRNDVEVEVDKEILRRSSSPKETLKAVMSFTVISSVDHLDGRRRASIIPEMRPLTRREIEGIRDASIAFIDMLEGFARDSMNDISDLADTLTGLREAVIPFASNVQGRSRGKTQDAAFRLVRTQWDATSKLIMVLEKIMSRGLTEVKAAAKYVEATVEPLAKAIRARVKAQRAESKERQVDAPDPDDKANAPWETLFSY